MRKFVWSSLLMLFSCVVEPQLVPDRTATRVGDTRNAATSEVAGVRVFVDGDAWMGSPVSLGEVVTPVRVTIENESGRPLRVAYADFALVGNRRYSALPMLTPEVPVSRSKAPRVAYAQYEPATPPAVPPVEPKVSRPAPKFESRGFFVSRDYRSRYPASEPWPRRLHGEPSLQTGRPVLPAELPSQDMLDEGIPEGVLENGGYVSGFVYFDRLEPKEQKVQFTMSVVDPDTGMRFGVAQVPLLVRW